MEERYKEYKGVWFYKTDRGFIRTKWTTSYDSSGNMSKTFITEEHAIKYIDDNNIQDYIYTMRNVGRYVHGFTKKINPDKK